MIKMALRRANRSYVFIVISALLFVAGFVGSTYAYFDGQTQLTGTYAGGYVVAPSGPAVTASGYDALLTWTAPAPVTTVVTTPTTTYGPVTTTPGVSAQRIVASDNGTSTSCTGATYDTTVVSSLPSTQATYTDANRANGSGNGHQWCYGIQSYYFSGTTNATTTFVTPSWYQQASAPVAQLGLAAQSVVATNGGTSGQISKNDTLVITYNQRVLSMSTPTLCEFADAVFIGDSTCTSEGSDPYTIGKITGLSNTPTANFPQSISLTGFSVSTSFPWTITMTIKTNTGSTLGGWTGGTFVNSSGVQSNAATDRASGCTSCTITPSGSW